ncbi:hypothetical protein ACFU5O_04685 [Streptomyces sp. NPDC057445]|uniref:hypothetical protein n=1 Tax=Streptomyces sp. NPDC057445 TaxID=3346136 RepID=UPI0036D16A6F
MDLDVDADELIKFKNRVDGLLSRLNASAAAPTKMADGTVPEGGLGKGFGEAEMLYTAYRNVREELQKLSDGLAGQIWGLSTAIDGSRKGYEQIDDDIKRRMQRVAEQAREDIAQREEEKRRQQEPANDEPAKSPRQGDSSGGTM